MIDLDELSYRSGFEPDLLRLWGDRVRVGDGFTEIEIPQVRRRPRRVLRPGVYLDRVLKQLNVGLAAATGYSPPDAVHGFVKGRGIFSNASQHLAQDVVLRIDLKDFFGTINRPTLERTLRESNLDQAAAESVANVALVSNSLAQGFSTSPLLSNMAFKPSDRELSLLARGVGVTYTRYVDDLIFSGDYESVTDQLLSILEHTLDTMGWSINHQKTRFMRRGKPQYVTGLYVGDSVTPHIPRKMKQLLRREVYYAAKFGVRSARLRSPTPIEPDRLQGWVNFAAHADPEFGKKLRAAWNGAQAGPTKISRSREWDRILNEIDFPRGW